MSSRYEHYECLRIEPLAGRVLDIVIDTPARLNAVDARAHAELVSIWHDLDADEDVSAAVIRGEGEAFCAGGDFEMLQGMATDHSQRLHALKEAHSLVYGMINCSKPIVSAVQGPAIGAGLACALLADIPIAARDAVIIDGHTRLGVAAGDHAVIIWPLLCGMAKAKYYLLTCEPLSGEEAERIGLVALTTGANELVATAHETARALARGSPSAIRWTKYALNNWLRLLGPTFDTALGLELLGFAGPDAQEGIAALRERREPRFEQHLP